MKRRQRALLASLTLILTAAPLTVVATLPAEAAYGECNSASWRVASTVGLWEYTKVPVRTGNGMHCYMGKQQGSKSAVMALQDAIKRCYWDTPASDYISASGGVDGKYGEGTAKAVLWLQVHRFGFKGSNRDGVYGPATRAAMMWPMHHTNSSGDYIPIYECWNYSGI
ncbi:peptidoglycan-binding domain-containing protein [Kribbella antibiotica]|nr:peptidoglycan-binding domain-containing protein [Kribbella antibiotica]